MTARTARPSPASHTATPTSAPPVRARLSGTCRIGHGWFMWLVAEEPSKGGVRPASVGWD